MANYALCGGKTNTTRSKRKKKSLLGTYKAIILSNQPKQYNISSDRLIRIWVKKWKISGDVALRPRMKGYPPAGDTNMPLTEVEKLQRDNYYLQMQVDVLKKLKALRENPPSANSPI